MKKSKIYLSLILSGAIIGTSSMSNTVYADTNFENVSTINESTSLKDTNTTEIKAALDKINEGTTDFSYYQTLGLDSIITKSDIPSLVQVIKSEKEYRGTYLSSDTLATLANNLVNTQKDIKEKLGRGQDVTTDDYRHAGFNVKEYQLTAVNNYYFENQDEGLYGCISTASDALDKINEGSTDFSYYKTLGLDYNLSKKDIPSMVQIIKSEKEYRGTYLSSDTLFTLANNLVNTQKDIKEKLGRGQDVTTDDYRHAGFNVKGYQLTAVNNYYFENQDEGLYGCISTASDALDKINEGSADFSYYKTLGLDYNLSKKDIPSMVQIIKSEKEYRGTYLSSDTLFTLANNLVDTQKDIKEKLGRGQDVTTDDYRHAGFNVKEYQLTAVNNYYFENQDEGLYGCISTASDALDKINEGSTDFSYYKTLGLDYNLSKKDIPSMVQIIKSEKEYRGTYLSSDTLFTLANNLVDTQKDIKEKLGRGQDVTTDDYRHAGFNVKEYQLTAVNNYYFENQDEGLYGCISTASDALDKINEGSTDFSYYKTLGLDYNLSKKDIPSMVQIIKSEKEYRGTYLSSDTLFTLANNLVNTQKDIKEKLGRGQDVTTDDYRHAGFNVKEYQLTAVNNYYFENQDEGLYGCISTASDALDKVNEGSADFSYYKTLGLDYNLSKKDIPSMVQIIKSEKEYRGTYLSSDTLFTLANNLVNTKKDIIDKLNRGETVTTDDYRHAGFNIKESELEAVNDYYRTNSDKGLYECITAATEGLDKK